MVSTHGSVVRVALGLLFALISLSFVHGVAPDDPKAAKALTQSKASKQDKDEVGRALNPSRSCCGALSRLRPGKVTYLDSIIYEEMISSYWSQQQAELHPTCVYTPTEGQEIAPVLLLLTIGDLIWPGKCDFSVRSGGHSPIRGWSNIENGIYISLLKLNKVTLSTDKKKVAIGSGAQWSEVYKVLEPNNVATSAGRAAPVGVGGLTTGGGISFFSPRSGFVCSNVLNFRVALPTGLTVDANAHENRDLWLALRGGSSNFGVVTNFDMVTFPQGDFFGGPVVRRSTPAVRSRLFAALEAFTSDDPNGPGGSYDEFASISHAHYIDINASGPAWFNANFMTYSSTEKSKALAPGEVPAPLEPFANDPEKAVLSKLGVNAQTVFSQQVAGFVPDGFRQLFATATFANSADMMQFIFDATDEAIKPLLPSDGSSGVENLKFNIVYQPIPRAIYTKSGYPASDNDNPEELFGLDPEKDGDMINLSYAVQWSNAADDVQIRSITRGVIERCVREAEKRGLSRRYLYLNYADRWQDPIASYGPEALRRLRATSRKYDPIQVMRRVLEGGFKLYPRAQAKETGSQSS